MFAGNQEKPKTRRVRVSGKRDKKDVVEVFPEEILDVDALTNFIKDKRDELQVTQKEICEKTGLSASTVSKIESGTSGLNIRCIGKILRFFNYRLHITYKKLSEDISEESSNVELN